MHPGLLEDILEHPEDDVPRLVLADWLDEHGQEERAEFIRVQIELARWKPYQPPPEIAEIASSGRLYAQRAQEILAEKESEHVGRHNALQCRQADLIMRIKWPATPWQDESLSPWANRKFGYDWKWRRG